MAGPVPENGEGVGAVSGSRVNRWRISGGIKLASSGVALMLAKISSNGRNPQRARNGVSASAISGLWLGSFRMACVRENVQS